MPSRTKQINLKPVSRFELLMDAGMGTQKVGDILIRTLAKTGKYVFIEPLIPSEISPPVRTKPSLSGVIIRLGQYELTNIGNDTDLILASHEVVLDRRLDDEETNVDCIVLLDMGDRYKHRSSYYKVLKRVMALGLQICPFEIIPEARLLINNLLNKGKNLYYLGMLSAIYQVPQEHIIDEIRLVFKSKISEVHLEQNIELLQLGFNYARNNVPVTYEIPGRVAQKDQILIDGNSALALGIIDAGIKLYSGYPITPASSIMHTLAKSFSVHGGFVHQAEDEIAAIGVAIGAYFGGVPSITGTSGPGLSLKQEFIGFASAAEIPVIIIDVQRAGPSTGMPTKTEQSDLPAALYGNHGDNTKIIISVADAVDCFYAPQIARYLAEKLRLPVIILSEFQTANSYRIIQQPQANFINKIEDIPDYVFNRFYMHRLTETINMVRPRQDIPGMINGMRRVTGLNTDESGSINYFAGANQRSHRLRNEKIYHLKRALKIPEIFGPDQGDILVVGWGSTRGALEEAIHDCQKQGLSASGMHLKIVYPLPTMLKEIFSRYKNIVTIEMTYADELKHPPLMMLLRSEMLLDINSITCRATGRPLRPKTIVRKIKEIIN